MSINHWIAKILFDSYITDKYYKIKADFGYLASYNYKITKEIGRGGYGVVYKVPIW